MQLGQKFSKVPSADKDIYYSKTRSMLSNLGLDHYEKNFKKGLLTDYTLPLLNDRLVAGFSNSLSLIKSLVCPLSINHVTCICF